MKYPKINRHNWRSLSKQNKKLFKQIMRDIHDEILNDIAKCQRLNDIKFASNQSNSYYLINGLYRIQIDHS